MSAVPWRLSLRMSYTTFFDLPSEVAGESSGSSSGANRNGSAGKNSTCPRSSDSTASPLASPSAAASQREVRITLSASESVIGSIAISPFALTLIA